MSIDINAVLRDAKSDERARTQCEFRPQSGGWYSRCRKDATSILVGRQNRPTHPEPGRVWGVGQYDRRRCDYHRAVDNRTAANSDWRDIPVWEPYEAKDALYAIVKARQIADAEAARLKLTESVERAAAAVLKHADVIGLSYAGKMALADALGVSL